MTLACKDSRNALAPDRLHCREDPELIVDHNVSSSRVPALDVGEHLFLVNVDEDATVDGLPETRALDLSRLKDDVSVGEDDGRPLSSEALDGVERARVEAVREWVVDEVGRDHQEPRVVSDLGAVVLQGAEVIGVAELGAQLFEDRSVASAARG